MAHNLVRYTAVSPTRYAGPAMSTHDIGLKDMIDAFYLLGKVPHILLFAVSISSANDVTTDLTPAIEELIPLLAENVLQSALKMI